MQVSTCLSQLLQSEGRAHPGQVFHTANKERNKAFASFWVTGSPTVHGRKSQRAQRTHTETGRTCKPIKPRSSLPLGANCATHCTTRPSATSLSKIKHPYKGCLLGWKIIQANKSSGVLGVMGMKNRLYYPNIFTPQLPLWRKQEKQTNKKTVPSSEKFKSFWSCSECNWSLGVACRHVSSVESAATCGSGSDAACGASIWKHEEGQRVSGKIQMSGRRLAASFKLRESFVIHHLQHFSVEFGGPSWGDGRSADGEMTDDLKVPIYFQKSRYNPAEHKHWHTEILLSPHLLQN